MERIHGKSCLVTGGAGFIGSHLCECLLQRHCAVTAYDNFSTGRRDWLRSCIGNPRFQLIEGDLADRNKIEESMRGSDVVWHFGANTNMVLGIKTPDIDFNNGIIATYNILTAMRNTGSKELIFPSSGSVYGDINTPPASEGYGPLLPVSAYGAAKLSAEAWISCFTHLYGLRSWIFRFGNVVGERMGHGIIFDLLAKLGETSREIEVLGDGTGEKNYFLVEECIDGMIYAYNNSNHTGCEIFNLGTDSTTSVREIVRIVLEETGQRQVRVRYTGGYRGWPGDQPRVYMTVSKMKGMGWSAKQSSDEAVRIATRRCLGKGARPS